MHEYTDSGLRTTVILIDYTASRKNIIIPEKFSASHNEIHRTRARGQEADRRETTTSASVSCPRIRRRQKCKNTVRIHQGIIDA